MEFFLGQPGLYRETLSQQKKKEKRKKRQRKRKNYVGELLINYWVVNMKRKSKETWNLKK